MEQSLEKLEIKQKYKLVLKREGHLIYIFNKKFLDIKLRYDLVGKRMEKLSKLKDCFGKDVWLGTSQQYNFFYNLSIRDIFCEEEHFKELIQKTSDMNPRCSSLSTFFLE